MTVATWMNACTVLMLGWTVGCGGGGGSKSDLTDLDTRRGSDDEALDQQNPDDMGRDDQISDDRLPLDQSGSDLTVDSWADGNDLAQSDLADGSASDATDSLATSDADGIAQTDVSDSGDAGEVVLEVPPLEQVADALYGTWDMTGFVDSGNALQEVPPGSQFNVFQSDGTVLMQCGAGIGMPFDIIEKWGKPTIHVDVGGGSEVFWVITKLTGTDLWYVEGGDEFRYTRRTKCP